MTLYVAIAYYSDGSGAPLVKFAGSDKDMAHFMRDNSYMEISVFKITTGGVELLVGKDLTKA